MTRPSVTRSISSAIGCMSWVTCGWLGGSQLFSVSTVCAEAAPLIRPSAVAPASAKFVITFIFI
ncbi:hypothetical protein [Pannonibacter phragmitetus]|uniref:hypothetical protein n=1 Tax=Pannonibacter phragmitetus TaxID=121719 RepID=UPI003D2F105C